MKIKMKFITLFALFLPILGVSGEIKDNFLYSLGKIESNNNDYAVGDRGKSISRYQIHYSCYLDAKDYDKSINFSYQSLTNKENADKVVKAYILRYCPKGSCEDWARLWNSGPNWRNKTNLTDNYVRKFKKELARIDNK